MNTLLAVLRAIGDGVMLAMVLFNAIIDKKSK